MIRFNVITLLCSLGVLQASSTLYLIDKCLHRIILENIMDSDQSLQPIFYHSKQKHLSRDIERYILSWLQTHERAILSLVAKKYCFFIEKETGQHFLVYNQPYLVDTVSIEQRKRLKSMNGRFVMDLLHHHPILYHNLLRGSLQQHHHWGMLYLDLYPKNFLFYVNSITGIWFGWLKRLPHKDFFHFYKQSLKHDPKGTEKWFRHLTLLTYFHNNPKRLVDCMKWRLTPTTINAFAYTFRLDMEPLDSAYMNVIKEGIGLLFEHNKLYELMHQNKINAYSLQNLTFKLVQEEDDKLAGTLFYYFFDKHQSKKSTELLHSFTKNVKKMMSIDDHETHQLSKKVIKLLNQRNTYSKLTALIALTSLAVGKMKIRPNA